jgi:hypothetical protein
MSCVHLDLELRSQAESLLKRLKRQLANTEESTNYLIDQGIVTDEIDPDERCVSPSDFGFHNAIQTPKGVRFIDFEFAGWDDPAKAVQDFILQPRVPVTKDQSPLLDAYPLKHYPSLHKRCEAITPILELKWLCILLGVLQPARLEEILIVMPKQKSELLIRDRLAKADRYFDRNR